MSSSRGLRTFLIAAVASFFVAVGGQAPATPPVVPNQFENDYQLEINLREQLPPTDFTFGFQTISTQNGNSTLRLLQVDGDPALGTLPGTGVSQNLVTLDACAINQPHSHPRATEISFITEGTLQFGFHEENMGKLIVNNVSKGQTAIIPQGLIHFAANQQCTPAQFIATFPNRDPGTQTTASNFFLLPDNVVRGTTGLSDSVISAINATIQATKNPSQDPVCLQACGLLPPGPSSPPSTPPTSPSGSPPSSPSDASATASANANGR